MQRADAGTAYKYPEVECAPSGEGMCIENAFDKAEPNAPGIVGFIDRNDGKRCSGWAWSPGSPSAVVKVTLKFGNFSLIEVPCNLFRGDLAEKQIGDGFHAFDFTLPYPIDESMIGLLSLVANTVDLSELLLHSPIDKAAIERLFGLTANLIERDVYDPEGEISGGLLGCQIHYLLRGRFDGRRPNSLFDPSFYVQYCAQRSQSNIELCDALLDFAEHGQIAGARPHPIFDPVYVAKAFDLNDRSQSLQWFLRDGIDSDCRPSYLFDPKWYKAKYKVSISALRHYLFIGMSEGLLPNPLFDPHHVANKSGVPIENALAYYVLCIEGQAVDPHILVDEKYIREQAIILNNIQSNMTGLEIYYLNHDRIDPNPLFISSYFRLQSGATEKMPALVDYVAQHHGRMRPHFLFWDDEYRGARPDVAEAGLAPLSHYLASGHAEAVKTHPLVDHDYIKSLFDEDLKLSPLAAYADQAIKKQLSPRGIYPVDRTTRRSWHRRIFRLPSGDTSKPCFRKIGLFAHVFYPDLIEEIIEVLYRLPAEANCYISTDTKLKKRMIEKRFSQDARLHFEVRVFPNRGRDIAPFLVGFADRIAEMDIGLHIHTKMSPHYSAPFAQWRRYLFKELAGSREIVAANIAVINEPNIGMVAPVDFAPIDPLLNWGGNRPIADNLVRAMGGRLPKGFVPEMPSGSMFWFKADALKPFIQLGLTVEHFEAEKGQIDGTLAHAIERSFFYICELAGYSYVRTTTQEIVEGFIVSDSIAGAASRGLPSAWRKRNVHDSYHPEAKRFVSVPAHGRPRLNLLIPTADMSVGYAGVSEAIRLFTGALLRLGQGWDARIVVTDVRPGNMFVPPDNFRLFDSYRSAEDALRSIVYACDKDDEFLTLRSNDVFMASAWWNASQAFDLIAQANDIFPLEDQHRKLIYIIQDDERGFNPWSTKYMMCDETYRKAKCTFAVFNTSILYDHFRHTDIAINCAIYDPPINASLVQKKIIPYDERDNIVLLYARPHAQRNCLDFIDAVVAECVNHRPEFWKKWRWLAIGEDFDEKSLRNGGYIEVLGRLSLEKYRDYLQTAKLGVSLMISPHPSYPPLEMAANGVRVVVNKFESRDLSRAHDLIASFDVFDPFVVAELLFDQATRSIVSPTAQIDWFFDEKTNIESVLVKIADEATRQAQAREDVSERSEVK